MRVAGGGRVASRPSCTAMVWIRRSDLMLMPGPDRGAACGLPVEAAEPRLAPRIGYWMTIFGNAWL